MHRLLRYFSYKHLKAPASQERSKLFHDLAHNIAGEEAVDEAEKTVALRKLLEAKDCLVRAHLPQEDA